MARWKNNRILRRIAAVLLALIVWQIVAVRVNSRILIVTPIAVARRLFTIWQVEGFAASICFSCSRIIGGFLLGLFVGILLAALAARWPVCEDLFWPWMAAAKSVPVASFVIICLIWLSARNLSIFISFLVVTPVIYQNMLTGFRQKDVQLEEMADVFEMSRWNRLRYLTIPQIAPHLISSCTVTAGMAWKAGVAAEIIGTPNGSIGRQLYLAKIYLDTDDMLAWTVIIVVMSVLWEKLFLWVLKRVLGVGKCR